MRIFILFYVSVRFILVAFYKYSILGFRVTDFVGAGFGLYLFLFYLKNVPAVETKFTKLYKMIIVWVLFSTFFSLAVYAANPVASAKEFTRLLTGFSIFAVFPMIFKNRKDVERLANAMLISTVFPVVQFYSQYLIGANIFNLNSKVLNEDLYMFQGVYGDYGVFGLTSCWGLLSLFILFPKVKNNQTLKYLYLLLFFIYFGMGLLTFSRTIAIIMIIIFLNFLLTNARDRSFKVFFLFLFAALIYFNSPMFKTSIQGLELRSRNELRVLNKELGYRATFHGRVGRWEDKLNSFFQSDLLSQFVGTNIQIGPHGDLITWLLKYGYIGLVLYSFFLARIIWEIMKLRRWRKDAFLRFYGTAVFTGVIIWVIMGITTNPSFMPDLYLVVMGNVSIFISLMKKPVMKKFNRIPTSAVDHAPVRGSHSG